MKGGARQGVGTGETRSEGTGRVGWQKKGLEWRGTDGRGRNGEKGRVAVGREENGKLRRHNSSSAQFREICRTSHHSTGESRPTASRST